jgi:hypothetical protein
MFAGLEGKFSVIVVRIIGRVYDHQLRGGIGKQLFQGPARKDSRIKGGGQVFLALPDGIQFETGVSVEKWGVEDASGHSK